MQRCGIKIVKKLLASLRRGYYLRELINSSPMVELYIPLASVLNAAKRKAIINYSSSGYYFAAQPGPAQENQKG